MLQCILQSWYIPCDFQLFLVGIPLNLLIRKNLKIGLTLISSLWGISTVTVFLIIFLGEKDPFIFMFNK